MELDQYIDLWANREMAQVVIKYPRILRVIERVGINIELREKTIEEVCNETHIDLELFIILMSSFVDKPLNLSSNLDFDKIPLMIQYLKNSHSYFLDKKLPFLNHQLDIFCKEDPQTNADLLKRFFREYSNEVRLHMEHENDIVFPYVQDLYSKFADLEKLNSRYSIDEFEEHHSNIEEKLSDLKNLLIKYFPGSNGIFIRNQFLIGLYNLEQEIMDHTKLEETILVPMVRAMERSLKYNGR